MVPLLTFRKSEREAALKIKDAASAEFPHHSFSVRNMEGGLTLVLNKSDEGPYSDAVQWYVIGFRDALLGRPG